MDQAPKVGTKLRYKGGLAVGPCVGIIRSIYPREKFDEDADWESETDPKPIGYEPESEWSVSFEIIGELPTPFAYNHDGNRKFAPRVKDLEPL